MPRNSRNYINATFFHIMVQGLNKEFIFNKDEDKKQYLKFVNKIKKEVNIVIISYCIMYNHVHILIKTNATDQLSKFMHRVNTLYAIYYNQKYNIFLEDENEKEEEIQNTIKEYLYANKLNLDTLKKDAEHLRKIISLLKNNYNLSLRKISTYINVGRETVRIIAKGI